MYAEIERDEAKKCIQQGVNASACYKKLPLNARRKFDGIACAKKSVDQHHLCYQNLGSGGIEEFNKQPEISKLHGWFLSYFPKDPSGKFVYGKEDSAPVNTVQSSKKTSVSKKVAENPATQSSAVSGKKEPLSSTKNAEKIPPTKNVPVAAKKESLSMTNSDQPLPSTNSEPVAVKEDPPSTNNDPASENEEPQSSEKTMYRYVLT